MTVTGAHGSEYRRASAADAGARGLPKLRLGQHQAVGRGEREARRRTHSFLRRGGIAHVGIIEKAEPEFHAQDLAHARILGVDAGTLAPGSVADVCLYAPDQHWQVLPGVLASQGKNTPFIGHELQGVVKHTLVDGKSVYAA